jgi:hypothetical protein
LPGRAEILSYSHPGEKESSRPGKTEVGLFQSCQFFLCLGEPELPSD